MTSNDPQSPLHPPPPSLQVLTPEERQSIQSSRAEVWYLKEISFGSGDLKQVKKVITQNYNGPCSFIAICNILILRGDIEIQPPDRTTVSYELLSQLVGEYVLSKPGNLDTSAALSIMPITQKGMDLNPLFSSSTSFRPAGDGGELKLFEQADIKLVHGWLVDEATVEGRALEKVQDYDTAVNLIVEVDHITKGQLLQNEVESGAGSSQAGPSAASSSQYPPTNFSSEERQKFEDALIVQNFLDSTGSQLTYHGLFQLASMLAPGALVALFRSSHLSVLHKSEGEDSALYTLVTDYAFLHEPSVVWERLDDIDGTTFVDSDFNQSTPVGGDFAGHTAESALAALEAEAARNATVDPADVALAQQLQDEEDRLAQQAYAERERQRQEHAQHQQAQSQKSPSRKKAQRAEGEKGGRKITKKPSCVIM